MKMICEVAGCGEELSEGTGSKGGPMLCKWCRGPRGYWSKQGHKAAQYRYNRLALFRSRLEYYDPKVAQIVNEAQKAVATAKRRAQKAEAAHSMRH
jgi:hypothetical protein